MNWRVIDTGPLPGPENMAIDEALLTCFDPETSPPVFRLYGWNPPAVSLGRFQDAGNVLDLHRCRTDNLAVVRRITGGGVIYHADELTYSIVCAPHHLPSPATVKESFRILTGFLLRFYRSLGLPAEYAVDASPDSSGLGERTPFCFAGRESFDILIEGRKIGGNAQRRLKKAVFQHGSIPVVNRADKGVRYLKEKPREFEECIAALADFGLRFPTAHLNGMLMQAFAADETGQLIPSVLTGQERTRAAVLLKSRYDVDSWNLQGENG